VNLFVKVSRVCALSSLRSALGISNKELATHTILRMFQSNPNTINNSLLF
jgi:hypothetical protein